ncbi:MAG: hypothetical protein ACRELY_18875, partial [Polyangiaceae bacterium]
LLHPLEAFALPISRSPPISEPHIYLATRLLVLFKVALAAGSVSSHFFFFLHENTREKPLETR